jgi:hypothetical protein
MVPYQVNTSLKGSLSIFGKYAFPLGSVREIHAGEINMTKGEEKTGNVK